MLFFLIKFINLFVNKIEEFFLRSLKEKHIVTEENLLCVFNILSENAAQDITL